MPEMRKAMPESKLTELVKMVAQKWSELSEDLKKPYTDLAAQLKAVYERQHAEWLAKGVFKLEDGTLSTDPANLERVQKMKCPEGTLEPKKPCSSYAYFVKHLVVPEGVKGVQDRAKLASEQWKVLSSKEKVKYEKMAADDKERFDKQMESVWLKGYFMLEDGTKSTEKVLKRRAASRSRPASEVVEPKIKIQKTAVAKTTKPAEEKKPVKVATPKKSAPTSAKKSVSKK
jgi:hypothetical protein